MKPDPYSRGRQRPLCVHERAFVPEINFKDLAAVEKALGLKPVSAKVGEMRGALLANLLLAKRSGREAIHYARDKGHYSDRVTKFYEPKAYRYTSVMPAVDGLRARELATEHRIKPSSKNTRRSQLVPGANFSLLNEQSFELVRRRACVVRLKDADESLVTYIATSELQAMSRDISEQNSFLERFHITVEASSVKITGGLLVVDGAVTNVATTHYYRSFVRTFDEGGRWYGPWWQNIPKEARPQIVIDGIPTVEEDYRTLHPRLICALARLDLPFDDPAFDFYGIDQVTERSIAKLAVNTMINAKDGTASFRSLCDDLRKEHDISKPGEYVRALVDKVAARYPALRPYWNTGIGCRLQRIDGDMCSNVQKRLRELNVPCLSVHDSFIVPIRHHKLLKHLMEEELDRARFRLQKLSP